MFRRGDTAKAKPRWSGGSKTCRRPHESEREPARPIRPPSRPDCGATRISSGRKSPAVCERSEQQMSITAFLTDSTLCIGCKACEVACKEWNQVSDDGMT